MNGQLDCKFNEILVKFVGNYLQTTLEYVEDTYL